jgi:hypothetical protein
VAHLHDIQPPRPLRIIGTAAIRTSPASDMDGVSHPVQISCSGRANSEAVSRCATLTMRSSAVCCLRACTLEVFKPTMCSSLPVRSSKVIDIQRSGPRPRPQSLSSYSPGPHSNRTTTSPPRGIAIQITACSRCLICFEHLL